MGPQTVLTEVDDAGIARVTINRPEVRNALDHATIIALTESFDAFNTDERVRAVTLTGAGSAFCSGADRDMLAKTLDFTSAEIDADSAKWGTLFRTINELRKPTLALVNGPAIGGGNGLVAACDIALAVPRASFQIIEIRLGLIPSTMAPFLIQAMGARAARRYFLTAEPFDAHEAHRIGLVHAVVPPHQLQAVADRQLALLRLGGPKAIGEAKDLIAYLSRAPMTPDTYDHAVGRFAELRGQPEGQEGMRAAFERRLPSWAN